MSRKRLIYLAGLLLSVGVGYFAWGLTSRSAYETAEYDAVEQDGSFEIRDYPELVLVSTNMRRDSRGSDGSFMRLFRYISGSNESNQKVSMTTPVFMESDEDESTGKMGFVIPKEVAHQGVPTPSADGVSIRKREAGRYAVYRFSGTMNESKTRDAEKKLRQWMDANLLAGEDGVEAAGYDPPFTPPPLRRNEVLIRIKKSHAKSSTK